MADLDRIRLKVEMLQSIVSGAASSIGDVQRELGRLLDRLAEPEQARCETTCPEEGSPRSEAHSSVAKGQSELDATLDLAPCCGRLADGRHPLNCRQRCQDCEGDPDGPTPCRCRPEPAVPEQAQPRVCDFPISGTDELGLLICGESLPCPEHSLVQQAQPLKKWPPLTEVVEAPAGQDGQP